MPKSFDQFRADDKIYIYPANRKFYTQDIEPLEAMISTYVESCEFEISWLLYNQQFVVFVVEEEMVLSVEQSDAMVACIMQIQEAFKIELLDKVKVFFKQGDYIQVKEMNAFKQLIKNRGVSAKTEVFNHFITRKSELESQWVTPAKQSWVSHLFK